MPEDTAVVDPARRVFEAEVGNWLANSGVEADDPLSLDGKTLRGVHSQEIPGVHLVSAGAGARRPRPAGLTLGPGRRGTPGGWRGAPPRPSWMVRPGGAAYSYEPRSYGVTLTKLETGPAPAALMAFTR